jgi:hypothetical protein
MENVIEITEVNTDFELVKSSDFEKGVKLKIISCTHDLVVYSRVNEGIDSSLFTLFIEFGDDYEKTIFLNLQMDELELFTNSLLKHIEIIKSNYVDQIKIQRNLNIKI